MMLRTHSWKCSVARKVGFAGVAVGLTCISSAGLGQTVNPSVPNQNVTVARPESGGISPAANTAVGNARVVVPDGTSLVQAHAAGETRWFVFAVEQGKTYTVEAIDSAGDLTANALGLGIFVSDGTSVPAELDVHCGNRDSAAPALQVEGLGLDGARCIVRTNVPDPFQTLNKRAIYASVSSSQTTPFQIRVRESTLYGRWTTNGYDFHVELQNTTTDAICAELDFYPGTGTPGPTGTVFVTTITIPAKGANKYVRLNGTTVNGDNRGTLRIQDCGNEQFVPGSLQLNTYAFSPGVNQFLPFSNGTANNGATGNSWQ